MKLIVGLGNPGEKYEKTRHNLGFMIVEHFLKDFQNTKNTLWENSAKFKSDIAQIEWQPRHGNLEKVILAKPQTYMNNSGLAVQLITSYYSPRARLDSAKRGEAGKLEFPDIWVIHDDIDLPLGNMKIRFGGASAGHHGVESIMEHLKTDKFWRFRMGTGSRNEKLKILASLRSGKNEKLRNVEDYVLGNFTGQERGKLKDLIKRGVKAVEIGLENGLEAAMNRFNTK